METRSKRRLWLQQQEEEEETENLPLIPVGPDPPPASSVDPACRNLADLPGLVLQSISDRLLDVPDLLSFSAVCRRTRSLAATSATAVPLVSRPPLLLRSFATPRQQRRFKSWPRHPKCKIQSIAPASHPRLLNSKLPSAILRRSCLGVCFGHIIFRFAQTIIIADVVTGNQIRFVSDIARHTWFTPYYCRGILTAPVSSPSCVLVLVLLSCTAFCRPSSGELIRITAQQFERDITSMAMVNGRLFCLGRTGKLGVYDLEPVISWQSFEFAAPDVDAYWPHHWFHQRNLVERNGELLLVIFSDPDVNLRERFIVKLYKLDLAQSAWIRIESLGNWTLFIDAVATCSLSCRDADAWGGRSNCVYVSGPGCETWSVFPVNGEEQIAEGTPLDAKFAKLHKFPSPLWVYPSTLY